MMKAIVNLLFEARILKEIPRSGFHFLGAGRESVAEHTFLTTFVGYVLSQLQPAADALKTIQMCLMHDLSEARTGDLNYVQKRYVASDEAKAVAELTGSVPFGPTMGGLMEAFRNGKTLEARLAHDADQLALVLELKALCDTGHKGPETWLPHVVARLQTDIGKEVAAEVLKTPSDAWWFKQHADDQTGNDT
jgi:putative hydrolase of HD superfamily